jgi:N-acyl homoserine lactone hydrolase
MKFLLVFLITITAGCSTSYNKGKMESYTPVENSWEEVFCTPGEFSVEVWNTGSMASMKYDGVINVKDERAKDLKGEMVELEVPVYYISGAKREFLIDAGLADDFDTNPTKGMKGLLKGFIIKPGKQDDGWSVKERFENGDLNPDYIFLTHMHFDHIAALQDFDDLPPVISGEGEEPISYKLLFESPFMEDIKTLKEIDFINGKDLYPFSNVVDIFGDGTFFAISNRDGHTSGHVSYILNGVDGIYFFPGDQVNIRENLERSVGPGSFSSDLEGAQKHFHEILEFLGMFPETKIMYGHDIKE